MMLPALPTADRAQSDVLGVALLTGVVVIVVGGAGLLVVGEYGGSGGEGDPLVSVAVEANGTHLTVVHAGGDTLAVDEVAVVARGGTTRRYPVDPANVSGDGDGQFEPSERFVREHGLPAGGVTVDLVDEASNTVVARQSVTVPATDSAPSASFGHTADPEPGESLTFDASGSVDEGSIAEYRWDWTDDGSVDATTTSPTITHTYGSTGDYDVGLTVVDDDGETATATDTLSVDNLRAPASPGATVQGVDYEYYEASDEYASMPDFGAEQAERTGTTNQVDLDPYDPDTDQGNEFAFRFTGYVEVPQDGQYTFRTTSDDGSVLTIGSTEVVDNRGLHANTTESGTPRLEAGLHPITVTMFEHTGQAGLGIEWAGPGVTDGTVPASALYRQERPLATFTADCDGLTCSFDASGTSNPSGSVSSYEWDFGDGDTASGETVTHVYDSAGDRTVTLTVTGDGGATDTAYRTASPRDLLPAQSPGSVTQGVDYEYYEASGDYTALSEVDWSAPTRTGTTDQVDLDPSHRGDDFAVRYQTYLDVPADDTYTFYTTSDDGTVLYVDGQLVVDNRGLHPSREASGQIGLGAGYHNVTVQYFEHGGQIALSASYESDSLSRRELPVGRLYRPDGSNRLAPPAARDTRLPTISAPAGPTTPAITRESFDGDATVPGLG